MKPKEKAQQLVENFKDYVHGYVGSSMLTNYEYPEQILAQAKKVAEITVYEIIEQLNIMWDTFNDAEILGSANHTLSKIKYWEEVKEEITNLK